MVMMSYLDTQRCDRDNRGLRGLSRLGLQPSLSFRTELTSGSGGGGGGGGWEGGYGGFCLKELVRSCLTWLDTSVVALVFLKCELSGVELGGGCDKTASAQKNLRSLPNSNKSNHVLLY